MGKVSPCTQPESLSFQLEATASCPPILYRCEKSHSISSMTLWWCWGLLSTPKPSLFPADPDRLPQSLLMGQVRRDSPLTTLGALPWAPSSLPMSLLCWVPKLDSVFGCGVRSATQRGIVSSPDLWALSLVTVQKLLAAFAVRAHLGVQLIALYDLGAALQHCRAAPQSHPSDSGVAVGHNFQVLRKYLHQGKMLQNLLGNIIFTSSVNKEWRCFLPNLKKVSNIFFKQQSFPSLWESGNAFCHLLEKKKP